MSDTAPPGSIDPAVPPSGTGCADCDAASPPGWWVHLRRCTVCGHVGCCDSSPSQHATAHAAATGHRVIQSFEPGEDWFWDYGDESMVDGPGARAAHVASRATSLRPAHGGGCRPTGATTSTDAVAVATAARRAARAGIPQRPPEPGGGARGRRPRAPVRRVRPGARGAGARPGRPARRARRRGRHLGVDRNPQARPAHRPAPWSPATAPPTSASAGRGSGCSRCRRTTSPACRCCCARWMPAPPRSRWTSPTASCRRPSSRPPPCSTPGCPATPAWCPPSWSGCSTTGAAPSRWVPSTPCSSGAPPSHRGCGCVPSRRACGWSRPTA